MKKYLLFLFAFVLIVSSCKKDNEQIITTKKMDNLIISPDFDYKTTKDVKLTVIMPTTVDYSEINSRIDFYYIENEQVIVVHSASADNDGKYEGTINIPDYLTELYVRSMAGDFTIDFIEESTKSSNEEIIIDYNTGYFFDPPTEITAFFKLGDIQNMDPSNYFKNTTSGNNLIQNGTFDDNNFGAVIPYWSSPMNTDSKWHITSQLNNYVAQYNDNGNNVLKITPSPSRYGGVAQLIQASPGELITLSADIKALGGGNKIGWIYLIPRNSSGVSLYYYSYQINNANPNWRNYTVAATMPNGTATVQVLLWMHIYGGEIQWDNVVVNGPITDADNDGINDDEDDYPNDPARAFDIFYPSEDGMSSLGFEDNWPGKGDYDFNDLVIDYRMKQVANGDNELVDLYSTFLFRAMGATLENGFGFEMNCNPDDIQSVSGTSITEDYISLIANNTEQGQTKGTIIVTDNAFAQLQHPGTGIGVNTSPSAPYVEPVSMDIVVHFSNPVALSQLGTAPFNPFMIVDKDRGREIHLSDHPPTSLANGSYFGTQHDDSDIATEKYYKTENNLPWAINIASSFDYPNEKVEIIDAYLKFAEWAESAGDSYPNWYLDEVAYRNSGNIYQTP